MNKDKHARASAGIGQPTWNFPRLKVGCLPRLSSTPAQRSPPGFYRTLPDKLAGLCSR